MGWPTRTSALPIRDLRQIAYLLPMWGGIASGVVFLWRRLICPQNSSLRMFWYRDLNSSHFFPRFGALEHEANRTPDISATFIGSRKSFVNTSGCLFVRQANESRLFCLSPTGWIVSIGAAEEELRPFKFSAKIWSARGRDYLIMFWELSSVQHRTFWLIRFCKNNYHLIYYFKLVLIECMYPLISLSSKDSFALCNKQIRYSSKSTPCKYFSMVTLLSIIWVIHISNGSREGLAVFVQGGAKQQVGGLYLFWLYRAFP